MKNEINDWEFIMRTNWEKFEYPPVIDENSFAKVLFRTTILFRKASEEMTYELLHCDDGVPQAIEDYIKYFDFLEKQVQQTRRMLNDEGYKRIEYETINS
jgi:tRNA U34 5-carboxymethylaminomethyl modifying enzyme MnmG/GidA